MSSDSQVGMFPPLRDRRTTRWHRCNGLAGRDLLRNDIVDRFRRRRFDSQGFVDSIQWGASSTALTYTPNPGANVRLDAELLL